MGERWWEEGGKRKVTVKAANPVTVKRDRLPSRDMALDLRLAHLE